MLYGENNPVDGAVLEVILRKAQKIREELGVPVPLPADTNKVMQTIMETVLLKTGGIARNARQLTLDLEPLGAVEAGLDPDWQSAKEKARATRTLFAQRRLRPEDVLPEWQKTGRHPRQSVPMSSASRAPSASAWAGLDARRRRLQASPPIICRTEVSERLAAAGIERNGLPRLPLPPRRRPDVPRHRAHPLVRTLADYVARTGACRRRRDRRAIGGPVRSTRVTARTILALLRLRHQIVIQRTDGEAPRQRCWPRSASPCSWHRDAAPVLLDDADCRRLLVAPPSRTWRPSSAPAWSSVRWPMPQRQCRRWPISSPAPAPRRCWPTSTPGARRCHRPPRGQGLPHRSRTLPAGRSDRPLTVLAPAQ